MPIGISLKGLLDKILTDPRWDLKFIGMQVVIEGLALPLFKQVVKLPKTLYTKKWLDLSSETRRDMSLLV